MTNKQRERSYEYYKQWQENKARYKNECVAYVLFFGIGLILILTNLEKFLLGIGLILVVGATYLLLKIAQKWYKMRKSLYDIKMAVKEIGAKNIEVHNNSISFIMSSGITDKQIVEMEQLLATRGLKMNIKREQSKDTNNDKRTVTSHTTDIGFINKNQQRNNGKTEHYGSDNNQYFYEMECLLCGHIYRANGTDIWQRKCPECQGGKP